MLIYYCIVQLPVGGWVIKLWPLWALWPLALYISISYCVAKILPTETDALGNIVVPETSEAERRNFGIFLLIGIVSFILLAISITDHYHHLHWWWFSLFNTIYAIFTLLDIQFMELQLNIHHQSDTFFPVNN